MRKFLTLVAATLFAFPPSVFAAIGCTLTNPAEDLKYLYPGMTSYKEELKEFPKLPKGKELFLALRERLGSDLDPVYETYETAYTVYNVFQGSARVGIVHGVNVPGKGGVLQVFLSADPKTGAIQRLFFQRLESPAAGALRDKGFRSQFTGLTLGDLYKHDYYKVVEPGAEADKVGRLKIPTVTSGKSDVEAALRGVRKNLILLDFFSYGRMFEPFFEKAKAAQGKNERKRP